MVFIRDLKVNEERNYIIYGELVSTWQNGECKAAPTVNCSLILSEISLLPSLGNFP